jgi:chlorophyllide a reductase subunit Z
VLVRISAAKRLRDAAERSARIAGESRVSMARIALAHTGLMEGQTV